MIPVNSVSASVFLRATLYARSAAPLETLRGTCCHQCSKSLMVASRLALADE
jgi:hypothetical protein